MNDKVELTSSNEPMFIHFPPNSPSLFQRNNWLEKLNLFRIILIVEFYSHTDELVNNKNCFQESNI